MRASRLATLGVESWMISLMLIDCSAVLFGYESLGVFVQGADVYGD